MNDSFRPEFLDAIRSAWWNWWFIAAYIIPFLLIVPACVIRWAGCVMSPVALFLFVAIYFVGVREYDAAFVRNAVTRAELGSVTADTGRVFMPFFRGISFGLLTTFAALAVGQILHPFTRPKHSDSNEKCID